MDFREAINIFLKRYSSILKQDPFLSRDLKKLKRDFFLNIAKTHVPKDSILAKEAIEIMIKNKQIMNKDGLDRVLNYPFFKKNIHNKKYYYNKITIMEKTYRPLIDVDKMEDVEYVEKLREDIKKELYDELMKEKEDEIKVLDDEIKDKKEELLTVPSILDEFEYKIPDVKEIEDVINGSIVYLPWWVKLGLKDDPFYVLEGLAKINSKLYDKIVQKTDIFKKYESIIRSSQKELFKNTVFYGQFGSGKTTFFDYINIKLTEEKIYPIYIQLGGEFEVRELIYEFNRQLNDKLLRIYAVLTGKRFTSLDSLDVEQAISNQFRMFSMDGINTFIIFIDDLHKGDLNKALRFMSYLQVLTSRIERSSYHLNLAFYIAGSLEWEPIISTDPKYSGSVARLEKMPKLLLDDAYEAINKRLFAYSKNIDNPRKLDYKFIETVYNEIEEFEEEVTFRRIIREVLNKLEANNFEILNVNPIIIDNEVLNSIKYRLERNVEIRTMINRFLYRNNKMSRAQKKYAFEVLVNLYVQRGILESEIRENDAPYLQQLYRYGLINKILTSKGLIWNISKDLWQINLEIIKSYQYSLEDYLLKLYFPYHIDEEGIPIEKIYVEIENLDGLIRDIKEKLVKDLLISARNIHLEILEIREQYLTMEDPYEIVRKCIQAIRNLTISYCSYYKIPIKLNIKETEILDFWRTFWWSPEIIQQLSRSLIVYEGRKHEIPKIISLYREAFPHMVNHFKEEHEKSHQLMIPLICLKNDEIELLHECRDHWINNEYKEIADKLTKNVERTIRSFLYNYFTILYGNFSMRLQKLDKTSRDYIERNITKDEENGFSVSKNEFQQLNRGQYKNIFTGVNGSSEGRRNWNRFFSVIFKQWDESSLDKYLDDFSNINVRVSHLKDDSITLTEQSYVYEFIQKTIKFLMDINKSYLLLLDEKYIKYNGDVKFSLNKFIDVDELTPIKIYKSDIEMFREVVSGKSQLRIPLDDQEYIQGITGLNYRKIYALLSSIKNQLGKDINELNIKMNILYTLGCELFVSFENIKE